MKKIVVDCTVLAQGVKTGVYRVAHELFRCLVNASDIEVICTITMEEFFKGIGVDLRARLVDYLSETNITVRFVDSRIDPAFVGADFYISPFFSVPDNWAEDSRVQKVVIAYDLIAITNPEFFEQNIIDLINEFYQKIQPDWLVLAISKTTKNDLLKHRPDLSEEKIVVTYLGADNSYKNDINKEYIEHVKLKYGVPTNSPYVLSVATLEVRKNLETAISAFAEYIRQSSDQAAMLVLVGMKGWKLGILEREIERHRELIGRIVLTGFVDEADLPMLYAGATGFVYMSRYEGFGLPPLEAMSCGVPVITSNAASLPEVVGDAGIMLEPDDVIGVANAYSKLLNNPDIFQYYRLLALQQADLFSWNKFGKDVLFAISEFQKSSLPYLSIITICYNEPHIRDTCESIHQQSFKKFEWIVIDGGSTDGTCEILQEYNSYITIFVSEPDKGRYDAMNKGIALSSGKYLLFLNGGDYLHNKDTLATAFNYSVPSEMMSLFIWLPTKEIIYGEVIAKETGMMPYPLWRSGEQRHDFNFFSCNSLPHQATFIQRALFVQFGLYNDTLAYAADYEWFIRTIVLNNVETQYIPLIISVYNFVGASSKSIAADAPHIQEIQSIYRHYSDINNKIAYPGLKWLRTDFYNNKHSVLMSQCQYASIDHARSVLDMVLVHLSDQELSCAMSVIDQTRSNFVESLQQMQLFLNQIRLAKLPLATLITYVHRLVTKFQSCSTVIQRVPYMRVLLYVKERLLQRNDWFEPYCFYAATNSAIDDENVIISCYFQALGRRPSGSEIQMWEQRFSEGLSRNDFQSHVKNSEEGQAYVQELQDVNAFAQAMCQNIGPHVAASKYLIVQNALRRLARNQKFKII